MQPPLPYKAAFHALREYCEEEGTAPGLVRLKDGGATPFQILVATIISLRTKDQVTLSAAQKLFAAAPGPEEIAALTEEGIADLIFPAGFYKTKAGQIHQTALLLIKKYAGEVPKTQAQLLELPGVGTKTANLVLNLAFGIKAICVDTHVHRIANRVGWAQTSTPEETEAALMKFLPEEYWIETNELLVVFGQEICTPAAPRCSACMFLSFCPKIGVVSVR